MKEETDKNADDVAHLKMLEKHFKERVEAYEVLSLTALQAIYSRAFTFPTIYRKCKKPLRWHSRS